MTIPHSDAKKLALDPDAFQQLLAAAYTMQENKNALQAANSEQDSVAVMSQIAALRSQILARRDEAKPNGANSKAAAEAAALVADFVTRVTKADGASVCLIVGGYLRPTAFSGTAAKVSGGSVASNSLVATERLRNGRAFQSANACSDIRLGPSLCLQLQIGSLLAFPIECQQEIAGLVEVRWTKADAFSDRDERICQLMAELMGEALEEEKGRANAQVNRLVHVIAPPKPIAEAAGPVAKSKTQNQDAQMAASDPGCRVCGKPLGDDLNFCGNCGMLSSSLDEGMQSKWASMWFMQQAQQAVETETSRGERLWPLHAENPQNANSHAKRQLTESDTDETVEQPSEGKRSPRRVLAVLKSRFLARAIGQ